MANIGLVTSCLAVLAFVSADVNIISKSQWGGEEANAELTKLSLPVARVIISHTASSDCNDEAACVQRVRNIQHLQMNILNFDDIGYNFLIGNDGNVYEGRGWEQQGAFLRGYNIGSLGIAFIGIFEKVQPSAKALDAAKALLEQGVALNKITADYKLYGARQFAATASPGDALYGVIKTWPLWSRKYSAK